MVWDSWTGMDDIWGKEIDGTNILSEISVDQNYGGKLNIPNKQLQVKENENNAKEAWKSEMKNNNLGKTP